MEKLIRIAVMMGLVMTGLASHADEVLYWMLDNPTITDWYNTQYQLADRMTTVKGQSIEYARVAAIKTTDAAAYAESRLSGDFTGDIVYLDLYFPDEQGTWVVDPTLVPRNDSAIVETDGGHKGSMESHAMAAMLTQLDASEIASYSFAVELGTWSSDDADANWILAAISGTETYAKLTDYIGQQLTHPDAEIWKPDAFAAPEPTSGLLTLMGLAFLGLKRKKVHSCSSNVSRLKSSPRG